MERLRRRSLNPLKYFQDRFMTLNSERTSMYTTTNSSSLNIDWELYAANPFKMPDLLKISPLYSLDIETKVDVDRFQYPNGTESNHPGGLDPRVSQVTSVAVTGGDSIFYLDFSNNEFSLLKSLQSHLETLPYGAAIVGWNIFYFDAPFLAVRYDKYNIKDHNIALTRPNITSGSATSFNRTQPPFEPKYGYPEWVGELGVQGWDSVSMMGHPVVDISPYFKSYADNKGIRCSLKEVAKSFGLNPVEIDIEKIDSLPAEEKMKYNISDTKMVLDLIIIGLDMGLFDSYERRT